MCKYKGAGTVCTRSDVIPYNVECWFPKVDLSKDIYKRDCRKAKRQLGEELIDYKKSSEAWAVKLFNKEIIDLRDKRNIK